MPPLNKDQWHAESLAYPFMDYDILSDLEDEFEPFSASECNSNDFSQFSIYAGSFQVNM